MRRVSAALGFLLIPALGILSPLLVIPAITSKIGASAWGDVAVAQSLGAAGAVLVELGWGLTGPQAVGRMSRRNQQQVIALSLMSRVGVAVPTGVGCGIVAVSLAQADAASAAAIAVGTALSGLTMSWFLIGARRPYLLALTETVPRIGLTVAAAIAIFLGVQLWVYAVAVVLSAVLAPALCFVAWDVPLADLRRLGPARLVIAVRIQSAALSGRALSALYIALPTALVGLAAPSALVLFASAERLQRMALQVLQVAPNMLQSWVGRVPDSAGRLVRARRATWTCLGLGLGSGIVYALLAPPVSALVFSHVATVPLSVAALSGVMIGVICVSRATGGLWLVSLRRIRAIASSAAAGSIIGVPAIFVLSALLGAAGGVLGEILAEATVLAMQLGALARPSTGTHRAGKRGAQHRAQKVGGR